MSLAVVYSRAKCGVEAPQVTVEAHISSGIPSFAIVGLPETAVKESRERVRSAILNSHFDFPDQRITVNLGPADLPKEGGRFDLAIALGILAASGQLLCDSLQRCEFVAELALTGELRPVDGCLPAAIFCGKHSRAILVAVDNADEAALATDAIVYCADSLLAVCALLKQSEAPSGYQRQFDQTPAAVYPDMRDVCGQAQARRALEIAATGQHNLLFFGPPGTGKTLLANRLPGILPPLTEAENLEVATVYSVANRSRQLCYGSRPFRNPHHSASSVALVGGGSKPRPGEISLAHRGVLFLDELPEFQRHSLEVLREPLESGSVEISRAQQQLTFPARFQLVAAMNPCPCGYFGDLQRQCRCTPDRIRQYRDKISGPLLDRIDMQVPVQRLPMDKLQQHSEEESSADIRRRVIDARQRQLDRAGVANAQLEGKLLQQHCELDQHCQQLLQQAAERLQLSHRGYHRIQRVARSIADLAESEHIQTAHLSEAIAYRSS